MAQHKRQEPTRRARVPRRAPPGMMTSAELCLRLGISKATEDRWRRLLGILPHHKLGSRIYYSEHHVEEIWRRCERRPLDATDADADAAAA